MTEHLRGYDVAAFQRELLARVSQLVKDVDLRKWAIEMALKNVFPAPAGMNRRAIPEGSSDQHVPRASGDESDGGGVISRADAIYRFLIAEINGATREEYIELSEIIAEIETSLGRTPKSPEEFLRFVTKRHIAFGVEELRASLVKRQLFAMRYHAADDADPDAYAQKIADEIARRDAVEK